MVQHFKNNSDCFNGRLAENVHEHFQNYELASNDYRLSADEKLAYLHDRLEGEEIQYYHSMSFAKTMFYYDGKETAIQLFDKKTRQVRVRQNLDSLTLTSIM